MAATFSQKAPRLNCRLEAGAAFPNRVHKCGSNATRWVYSLKALQIVPAKAADAVFHGLPLPPCVMTIGTAPADIASTVVIPKCSGLAGNCSAG